jgi:putative transposase
MHANSLHNSVVPYRYLKRTDSAQYHYVYNVGAGNKVIFRTARDYERFIQKIQEYIRTENRVRIIAYCLTSNSFHIIAEELEVGGIASLLHRLSVSYAMYFNARYKELGHLFRGPYKEEEITSDDQLIEEMSKLHALPCSQKNDPKTYRWSSYQSYLRDEGSWLYTVPVEEYFQGSDIALELKLRTDPYCNSSL